MSACCFVMFPSPGISLDDAVKLFEPPHWFASRDGDALVLQYGESPQFRVTLASNPDVAIESKEIGEGSPHAAALANCDRRFEIAIDDLGAALDEFNTLMEVQSFLQDATQGYLFLCWNGELLPPD